MGEGRGQGRGERGGGRRKKMPLCKPQQKHLTRNSANQIKYSDLVPEESWLKLEMTDRKEIASIGHPASLSSFTQRAHLESIITWIMNTPKTLLASLTGIRHKYEIKQNAMGCEWNNSH